MLNDLQCPCTKILAWTYWDLESCFFFFCSMHTSTITWCDTRVYRLYLRLKEPALRPVTQLFKLMKIIHLTCALTKVIAKVPTEELSSVKMWFWEKIII